MAHPEYLFYVLMFGVAAPAAWRGNHVAAAVFLRWALAMVGDWFGLPEPAMLVVLFSAAFSWLAIDIFVNVDRYQRRRDVFAWLAFVPLQIIANQELAGTISPWLAWWLIYWIGVAQVVTIVDRKTFTPITWVWHRIRRAAPSRDRMEMAAA